MIKVVKGNPTPEELAAALAVVQARAAASNVGGEGSEPTSQWSDPARLVPRRVPHPGPHAWRTTYWPA